MLGQALLQSGYIECVSLDATQFTDSNSLYRCLPVEPLVEEVRNDSSAGELHRSYFSKYYILLY